MSCAPRCKQGVRVTRRAPLHASVWIAEEMGINEDAVRVVGGGLIFGPVANHDCGVGFGIGCGHGVAKHAGAGLAEAGQQADRCWGLISLHESRVLSINTVHRSAIAWTKEDQLQAPQAEFNCDPLFNDALIERFVAGSNAALVRDAEDGEAVVHVGSQRSESAIDELLIVWRVDEGLSRLGMSDCSVEIDKQQFHDFNYLIDVTQQQTTSPPL